MIACNVRSDGIDFSSPCSEGYLNSIYSALSDKLSAIADSGLQATRQEDLKFVITCNMQPHDLQALFSWIIVNVSEKARCEGIGAMILDMIYEACETQELHKNMTHE